jgi:hypothetical protein
MEIPVGMNIPSVQIQKNVSSAMPVEKSRRTWIRYHLACFCLIVTGGCSALPGIPDSELAAFGPSVEQVRSLLQQDRVREALDEALYLAREYPSGLTETLVGQAMWRNGRVTEAEARFRRAVKTDLAESYVGLAAVRASAGRWDAARRLLSDVSGNSESGAWAQSLLASSAWRSGDLVETRTHLQAWSQIEEDVELAQAAAAMAAAVADLEGPSEWSGAATLVELETTFGGGLVVPVRIGGAEGRLLLDLAARQSFLSPELAEAGGLTVRSGDGAVARTPDPPDLAMNRHRPHSLQAACPDLQFGQARLRNSIVGVGQPPEGVDGVLAFDLLLTARWSLRFDSPLLALGPADASADVHQMIGGSIPATVAWLNARLAYQALAVQVFVYPLVGGERVAVGLDPGMRSMLDPEQLLDGTRPRERLQMGGWSAEVEWEFSSLDSWATAGGVAPSATLGHNLMDDWILHWMPGQEQIRFDRAAASALPADAGRRERARRQRQPAAGDD